MNEAGVTEVLAASSDAPRLSRAAVWILLLLPIAFFPLFRVAFPHVGLWPAAVIALLCVLTVRRSSSALSADTLVARAGFAVVVAVGAFTAVAAMAGSIPGDVPRLELAIGSRTAHWSAKAASFGVLILSISLHECAHALSAWYSGDSTARDAGRLTLNPLRHIDPFGTIILPVILTLIPGGFVFGWAKPVPVSPGRFRNLRRGGLATSAAGVAANLTLSLFFACCLGTVGVLLHLYHPQMISRGFMNPWREVELEGLAGAAQWGLLVETLKAGVSLNMILFWLNVIPVPPLDGFGLLEGVAPRWAQSFMSRARGWGSILFLVLIFTRALDYLLIPAGVIALFLNYFAGAMAKLA